MVIIKSNKKNWEGKGFADNLPAKIYNSFEDAVTAIQSYHFYEYSNGEYQPAIKTNKLEFIFLKEDKIQQMIIDKKIRF